MAISFQEICEGISTNPEKYVEKCDQIYNEKIERCADRIIKQMNEKPVILLSGPSGSGKTTSSKIVEKRLEELGIQTHTVSMDDYYRTVGEHTHPLNEKGEIDFESPLCLDLELLNEHLKQLMHGEKIQVPVYDFVHQKRAENESKTVQLKKNEIVIYEGIHALNPEVIGDVFQNCFKVYISARSNIEDQGKTIFKGTWIRLCRRMIRDSLHRGTNPLNTMSMWSNIRRGEKKYISPYKQNSDFIFDTAFGYEVSLLRDFILPLMKEIPNCPREQELEELRLQLQRFPSLDPRYIQKDCLLREFIGGGIY